MTIELNKAAGHPALPHKRGYPQLHPEDLDPDPPDEQIERIARCEDCDWSSSITNLTEAKAEAKAHYETYRHSAYVGVAT